MNFPITLHSGQMDQEVAVATNQSWETLGCRILSMSLELEVIREASPQYEEEDQDQ